MAYARDGDDGHAGAPAELVDSWLLSLFPGRFLHEIDEIDYARLMRALDARRVERIEKLREQQIAGKAKPTVSEWEAIREHERLYETVRVSAPETN